MRTSGVRAISRNEESDHAQASEIVAAAKRVARRLAANEVGVAPLKDKHVQRLAMLKQRSKTKSPRQLWPGSSSVWLDGRLLTGHAFRHLGLAEPARDPAQFRLFTQEDD